MATSATVPVTGLKLVDPKKLGGLVDQLRLAVPQDVRASQELIEKTDRLLYQAQADAKRTLAEAEEEFKTRLDESEVMVAATAKANELVDEAQNQANMLLERAESESRSKRTEADAYALQALRNLDQQLTAIMAQVKKGVEVLSPHAPVGSR